jgi:NADH:ubiquinone oxidoreductase subunit
MAPWHHKMLWNVAQANAMDRAGRLTYINVMATIGTRIFTWFHGRQVGHDGQGNIYYEERRAPRNGRRVRRWVLYAGVPDASAVPPEWHPWLHYTTDAPLLEMPERPWQKPHLPNLTGTPAGYRPAGHDYSGGQRARATGDYEAWTPDAPMPAALTPPPPDLAPPVPEPVPPAAAIGA